MASSTARTSGWRATWRRAARRSPSTSTARTTRFPCMKSEVRRSRVLSSTWAWGDWYPARISATFDSDPGLTVKVRAWRATPLPSRASTCRADLADSGVSGSVGLVSRRML